MPDHIDRDTSPSATAIDAATLTARQLARAAANAASDLDAAERSTKPRWRMSGFGRWPMKRDDAIRRIRIACESLHHGYAHDICASLLDYNATAHDCDALFRTLVLDEGYDVERARMLLIAACIIVGGGT